MRSLDFIKYHQSVQFLESLANLSRPEYLEGREDPSIYLKRTQYLLNLVGNPEKEFKFIHVAGTSGKGSVASMIQSILCEAGYKSGVYFSPHTTTSIERIQVGRKYISPHEFSYLVDYLKPSTAEAILKSPYGPPSYFEIFFTLALLYFKKKRCEYAVLEVGCGGAYDASNVITKAEVSIITNVDYDHQELLGTTLKEIARQKAGIIKRSGCLITGETKSRVLRVLEEECKKKQAKLIKVTPQRIEQSNNVTMWQSSNLLVAIRAAQHLNISERVTRKALLRYQPLPCRIEKIQEEPWVILDGAHNVAKIKALKEYLLKEHLPYKKLWLIIGIAQNKKIEEMLKIIIPLGDRVFITRFLVSLRKCADLKLLYQKVKKLKSSSRVEVFVDPYEALKSALKKAHRKDLIVVTGSLFLCGELRKYWVREEEILQRRKSWRIKN